MTLKEQYLATKPIKVIWEMTVEEIRAVKFEEAIELYETITKTIVERAERTLTFHGVKEAQKQAKKYHKQIKLLKELNKEGKLIEFLLERRLTMRKNLGLEEN